MYSTLPQRLQIAVVAFLMAFATVLGALPARAHTEAPPDLPFETRFVQEVDETYFFSSFGDARPGGRRHEGNDLMAPKMTEVYAFASGVVIKVAESRRPGRYLIIDHGGGWETYYIHLNDDNPGTDDGHADWSLTFAPGIEEGAEVEAGQLIAWVGDSGNAEGSGSHTHFELRYDDRAVDPFPYLKKALEHQDIPYQWISLETQIF
jgi:murein DD-endopeptidase MepM/ murein hydrolase activator NlpD